MNRPELKSGGLISILFCKKLVSFNLLHVLQLIHFVNLPFVLNNFPFPGVIPACPQGAARVLENLSLSKGQIPGMHAPRREHAAQGVRPSQEELNWVSVSKILNGIGGGTVKIGNDLFNYTRFPKIGINTSNFLIVSSE